MKPQAAIYARVSTEEQKEGMSLDAQVHKVKAKLESLGYQVPAQFIFREQASGADADRPKLSQVLELVRKQVVAAVGMYDPDRLARDTVQALLIERDLKRHNVALLFATTEHSTTPEGQMFYTMRAAFAQFEREVIKRRATLGKNETAQQGFWPSGKVPFGYQIGKVDISAKKSRNKLIPHPSNAALVRQIFDRVAQGESTRRIVRWLRKTGQPSPKGGTWGRSTIFRILTNPAYVGTARYNKYERVSKTLLRPRSADQQITLRVPALVAQPVWDAAQRRLKENKRLANVPIYPMLLRGLVTCQCGGRMRSAPSHGVPYYRCGNRDSLQGRTCRAGLVRGEKLDAAVWNEVLRVIKNPDLLGLGIRSQDAQKDTLDQDIARVQADFKRLDAQERRLLSLLADPELSAVENIKTEMKRLQAQRADLDEQRRHFEEVKTQRAAVVQQRDHIKQQVAIIQQRLRTGLSFEERRVVIRSMVTRVVVGERIRVDGRFLFTPPPTVGGRRVRVDQRIIPTPETLETLGMKAPMMQGCCGRPRRRSPSRAAPAPGP